MANFNKVLLIGNLTRDPEPRYTPAGTAVVNLRLAVNRRYKDRNGEFKDEACFLTVVVWNKQAETCNQYLKKGSSVFIEGLLQSRSWEDAASGKTRSVVEVRAERVQFLGSPGGRGGQQDQHSDITGDIPQDQEQGWPVDESEEKVNES